MATFAQRLFRAPANSVSSERAFSVQNLLHTETRNRTLPERAIKLEFLYINSHILRQKQEKREDWLTLGEDGEVEMEDYFMLVTEATGLGKRQREDSDDEIDEV